MQIQVCLPIVLDRLLFIYVYFDMVAMVMLSIFFVLVLLFDFCIWSLI